MMTCGQRVEIYRGSINKIPVALYELYNNDLDANGSVQRRTLN